MTEKSQLVKLFMQVMMLLGILSSCSYADAYDTLVWKTYDESDVLSHLVIELNKKENSFVIRRLMMKNVGTNALWEEFIIQPDVDKYEEQYIYSFLKQLFSIKNPYEDFSADKNDEISLCQSRHNNCIRVSPQLFGRKDGESFFCKYINQLE